MFMQEKPHVTVYARMRAQTHEQKHTGEQNARKIGLQRQASDERISYRHKYILLFCEQIIFGIFSCLSTD